MNKALLVLGFFAVMLVSMLLTAFTVSTLWTWFIAPLGLAKIGYAHAYGIALFASLLQGIRGLDKSGKQIDMGMSIFQALMVNLVALFFGYIAVGLM